MELKKMLAFGAVLGLALLASVPRVAGECCKLIAGPNPMFGVCNDCKKPRVHYCGKPDGGGCNMFGCNCGGGCIEGSGNCARKKRRSLEDAVNGTDAAELAVDFTGRKAVNLADKDGDGMLDGVEIALFLEQEGIPAGPNEWRDLDVDNDGKLAAHEIDHDLEKHVAVRKIAISFQP